MATAPSSSDGLAVASWGDGSTDRASKSDRYLARRLAEAGADFKSVAYTTFFLATSVAAVGWLACGIALEHWIVRGGLPVWARWAWLGVAVVALLAAAVRWLVPLVRYRVNLVYAARALEGEHPELHNDLVNTVLVKARGADAGDAILRSLERRTARRLSKVPNDGTADRTVAVRLALALAILVAAASLYEIAAPKSLLQSAARLLAPWAGIAAPARVRIEAPRLAWRQPGDTGAAEDDPARRLEQNGGVVTLVRGRQLVVTSEVRGLAAGERPVLLVAPARDDGSVDAAAQPWEVEMKAAGAEGRHRGVLPDAVRGLEHGIELVIAAGDARSERIRVAVVDTPALLVREVRYDYPAYTGLGSDTVAWQGDLRAVEGTRATIIAEGNRPLHSAWIDLDCDGKPDKELRVTPHDLARASGSIEMRLNADRSGPAHRSYRLLFTPRATSAAAREDAVVEKLEHRIDVLPDVPPEVSIEEPREPLVTVPPGAPVTIRVRALDPDFGLARVTLETRLRGGAQGPVLPLFDAAAPPGAASDGTASGGGRGGAFTGAARLVPERLGATPGSVLEYRAVATDTRPQEPNVQATPWQALKIDPSAPPRQPEVPSPAEQPDANREPARDSGKQDGQPDNGQGDAGQQGGGGESGVGERGEAGGGEDGDGRSADGKEQSTAGTSREGKSTENKGQSAENGGQGDDSGAERQADAAAGQADQPGSNESGSGESQQAGADSGRGKGDRDGADGRQQKSEQPGEGHDRQGGGQPGGDQQARDQQGREQQGREQQQAGDGQRGKDQAQQQGDQQQGGERKPAETVAADGTNDGEAFERILEQRQREALQQDPAQKPNQQSTQQQSNQQQSNQQQSPQQQCKDAEGKPCGKESCSSCQGQGQGQGQPQGQGQDGQRKEGQGQQGQGQQGQGAPGGGQPSRQTAAGNEPAGPQPAGPQGEGQRQPGGQQGAGQQGEGQAAGGTKEGGQPGGKAGEQAGEAQQTAGGKAAGDKVARGDAASSDAASSDTAGSADDNPAGKPGTGQAADDAKSRGAGEQGAGEKDVAAAGEAGKEKGEESAGSTTAGALGGDGGRLSADGSAGPREMEWTDQDLAHARNAADLALTHLRDSLAAGRSDVLDALGWTPDQARAFLDRWQTLRQMAGSDDPRQRGEFERTLRSLGLRPGGVKTSRDVPADAQGGQAEGRRGRPPASYREQFQAFLRGTGGE